MKKRKEERRQREAELQQEIIFLQKAWANSVAFYCKDQRKLDRLSEDAKKGRKTFCDTQAALQIKVGKALQSSKQLQSMADEVCVLAAKFYCLKGLLSGANKMNECEQHYRTMILFLIIMGLVEQKGEDIFEEKSAKKTGFNLQIIDLSDSTLIKKGAKFKKDIEFQELIVKSLSTLLKYLADPKLVLTLAPWLKYKNTIINACRVFLTVSSDSMSKFTLLTELILYSIETNQITPTRSDSNIQEFETLYHEIVLDLIRPLQSNHISSKQLIQLAKVQYCALYFLENECLRIHSVLKNPAHALDNNVITTCLTSIKKLRYDMGFVILLATTKLDEQLQDLFIIDDLIDCVQKYYLLFSDLIEGLKITADTREATNLIPDDIDLQIQIEIGLLGNFLNRLEECVVLNKLHVLWPGIIPMTDQKKGSGNKVNEINTKIALEAKKRQKAAKKNIAYLLKMEKLEEEHLKRIQEHQLKNTKSSQETNCDKKLNKQLDDTQDDQPELETDNDVRPPNKYDICFSEAMDFLSKSEYTKAKSKYEEIISLAIVDNDQRQIFLGQEGKLFVTCLIYQQYVNSLYKLLSKIIDITNTAQNAETNEPIDHEQFMKSINLFAVSKQLANDISGLSNNYLTAARRQLSEVGGETKSAIEFGIDLINTTMNEIKSKSDECCEMLTELHRRINQRFEHYLFKRGQKRQAELQKFIYVNDPATEKKINAPSSYDKTLNAGKEDYINHYHPNNGKPIKMSNFSKERLAINKMIKGVAEFKQVNTALFQSCVANGNAPTETPAHSQPKEKKHIERPARPLPNELRPLTWLKNLRGLLNGLIPSQNVINLLNNYFLQTPADLSQEYSYLLQQLQMEDSKEYVKLLIEYDLLHKIFGINLPPNLDIERKVDIAIRKLENISGQARFFAYRPEKHLSYLSLEKNSAQLNQKHLKTSIDALDLDNYAHLRSTKM